MDNSGSIADIVADNLNANERSTHLVGWTLTDGEKRLVNLGFQGLRDLVRNRQVSSLRVRAKLSR